MKYILLITILTGGAHVGAVEVRRRSFLGLFSLPFAGRARGGGPDAPLLRVTEPFVRNRADQLAGVMNVRPLMGQRLPGIHAIELEIVRHWQSQRPEARPDLDELIEDATRDFETVQATKYEDNADFFAGIDRANAKWAAVTDAMIEMPWASLEWSRVFAEPVARAQGRVAERLGVDVGLAHQLFDHAHPAMGGHAKLIRDLAREYAPDVAPLYAADTFAVLLEEMTATSPALGATLKGYNDFDPTIPEIETLIITASQFIIRHWSPDAIVRFTFKKMNPNVVYEPPDPRPVPVARRVPDYVRALTFVEMVERNARRLGPSPLRDAIVTAAGRLVAELREELAVLPERWRAQYAQVDDARDWSVGGDESGVDESVVIETAGRAAWALDWARTLRTFNLETVATLALAHEDAACANQLTFAPVAPVITDDDEPAVVRATNEDSTP